MRTMIRVVLALGLFAAPALADTPKKDAAKPEKTEAKPADGAKDAKPADGHDMKDAKKDSKDMKGDKKDAKDMKGEKKDAKDAKEAKPSK